MPGAEEEEPKARAGHAGDGRTGNLSGVDEKASRGRKVSFNPLPGRQSRKPDGAVRTYLIRSRQGPGHLEFGARVGRGGNGHQDQRGWQTSDRSPTFFPGCPTSLPREGAGSKHLDLPYSPATTPQRPSSTEGQGSGSPLVDTQRGGGAALPSACRPSPCPPNPSRMGLELLVSGVGSGREPGSRMRAQPSCQLLVSTLISLRRRQGRGGVGGEELMSY